MEQKSQLESLDWFFSELNKFQARRTLRRELLRRDKQMGTKGPRMILKDWNTKVIHDLGKCSQ